MWLKYEVNPLSLLQVLPVGSVVFRVTKSRGFAVRYFWGLGF